MYSFLFDMGNLYQLVFPKDLTHDYHQFEANDDNSSTAKNLHHAYFDENVCKEYFMR